MSPPIDAQLAGQVHAALEKTNGKYGDAAEMLGMDREEVFRIVQASEELRARWGRCQTARTDTLPPDPGEFASRTTAEDISEQILQECNGDITKHPDLALGKSLHSENLKLKSKGIEGLKLNEEDMEMAIALQSFQRNQISTVIEIGLASSVRLLVKLNVRLEKISAQLDVVEGKIAKCGTAGDERSSWVSEQGKLMRQFTAVSDAITRIKESDEKGLLVHAMVRKAMRESEGKNKKLKPKYGESDITVLEAETA